MTVGVADVDRWDPEAIRAVAEAAAGRAEAAAAAGAALAVVAEIDWAGVVSEIADEMIGQTRAALKDQSEQAADVARELAGAADRVAVIKAALTALDDDAGAEGCEVDRATARVVPSHSWLQARLDRLLAEAEAVDDELARAVGAAGGALPAATARTGVPASGADPEDVRRWWESLGPAEQDRLLAARPVDLGNLDGIPVAARDRANRAVLAADLASGDTAAAEVREGLELNSLRTGAPTLLWLYQPRAFGGQGCAAIAVGDPDTAAHTAVLVPGTGNSVTSGWLDELAVSNLFNEMTVTGGPSEAMSVVAWMGYDAPDSMIDRRVATPGLARQGGALLARDVRSLAVTGGRDSHTTVVGHSYGSTTVADAAAGARMPADDIVLIGSPGTDLASTATDFRLPEGGGVYVGSASGDPVTFLAGIRGGLPVGLGADPAAAGFGSTRFRAEVPGMGLWEDHVRYFDTGSESLAAIAHVAAGDGARLAEHGMTAPPRGSLLGPLAPALGLPNWSTPWTDPELGRRAGTGRVDTGGRP